MSTQSKKSQDNVAAETATTAAAPVVKNTVRQAPFTWTENEKPVTRTSQPFDMKLAIQLRDRFKTSTPHQMMDALMADPEFANDAILLRHDLLAGNLLTADYGVGLKGGRKHVEAWLAANPTYKAVIEATPVKYGDSKRTYYTMFAYTGNAAGALSVNLCDPKNNWTPRFAAIVAALIGRFEDKPSFTAEVTLVEPGVKSSSGRTVKSKGVIETNGIGDDWALDLDELLGIDTSDESAA